MSKLTFDELVKIQMELLLPFYAITRATPLPKQFGRNENDAEHSWGLALMACAIAPIVDQDLNVGLVCQFAVLHDLVEVYAGDTPNFATAEQLASKPERERAALQQLEHEFKDFPWLSDVIHEYELQNTPEARFIKSLDKTLALMQEFASEGRIFHNYKITKDQFKDKLASARSKASAHDELFNYYLEAEKRLLEHPEFFYQADQQ